MTPTALSQIIDRNFSQLDKKLRSEITVRVTEHIFEVWKDKVFANDSEGLKKFEHSLESEPDFNKRTEEYGKQIAMKFFSLSTNEQQRIDLELKDELNRVITTIYKQL